VSTAKGSNFSVRNLFYNVPARRKFLKSDNVEFKHIVTEFIRVALTRPDIGFTLTHNGKDVYVLKPAMSLKYRVRDVIGANVTDDLVDIGADTSVALISGFVGRPDAARKMLGNQYFFVNGRFFKSPYLHKAVMKAYENMIPDGYTPSYFIYMTIDPQSVDVNIHPTKTEIKFEDDSIIFQTLYACIREVLGRNSFGESIDFDREGMPEIPALGGNFDEFRPITEPQLEIDDTYNPFDNDGFPSVSSPFANTIGGLDKDAEAAHASAARTYGGSSYGMPSFGHDASAYIQQRDDYGKLFEDKLAPGKSVLMVQGKYIVSTSRSGLMIINAPRAMERILYDRFTEALSMNSHLTQTALFPVTVQVGVENMCLFQEHAEMLASLGFDIAPFGPDTIVVNGVPEGYSAEAGKVIAMVSDLLLVLAEDHSALPEMMVSNMAARLAKLGALSSDPITNPVEAQRLIDSLLACENPEYTSAGRRVIALVPTEEIEKKF
jgi:DNA mismatch repair protein MutL